ncbi:MAG: pyridoxamine 5'-phosphate oxidase family protein [Candidatus Omnitrophica bacterium]|nr:pyridoxamine 5'-phosphate oxidase family protein [Candidatus Omnitrophota bacterium]
MKMPEKVKDIFNNEPVHQFATSSKTGVPNISNVGAKYLLDDETIIIVDNYMVKTLSNIIENPAVSILIRSGRESYQIKGSCSYFISGDIYEKAKKWMKSIGEKYPAKGALQIKVENIYNSNSAPGSGERFENSDK